MPTDAEIEAAEKVRKDPYGAEAQDEARTQPDDVLKPPGSRSNVSTGQPYEAKVFGVKVTLDSRVPEGKILSPDYKPETGQPYGPDSGQPNTEPPDYAAIRAEERRRIVALIEKVSKAGFEAADERTSMKAWMDCSEQILTAIQEDTDE